MKTVFRGEFFRLSRSAVLLLAIAVLLVCDLFISSRSKVTESNLYDLAELPGAGTFVNFFQDSKTSPDGAAARMRLPRVKNQPETAVLQDEPGTKYENLIEVYWACSPYYFRWVLASNQGLMVIPLIFAVMFLARDFPNGMQDAVPHGLTGAVLIIIVVLGLGVVHRHHGTGQAALPLPGLQPQDAGGGLLAAAQEAVPILRAVPADEVYQVSPVVDEDVGTAFQRLPQEAVVPRRIHAVDAEGLHPQGGDPRRHVVLGGQRVGTGEEDLRPALFQHQGQVRSLGLQMHGNGDALPRKGLFPLKTGLDP